MALIYVEEKLQNGVWNSFWYLKKIINNILLLIVWFLGSTKRVSSNDIVNYLMQPAPKQQLLTMGVENIFSYAGFTEENLREYYENPPAGMKINSFY